MMKEFLDNQAARERHAKQGYSSAVLSAKADKQAAVCKQLLDLTRKTVYQAPVSELPVWVAQALQTRLMESQSVRQAALNKSLPAWINK